MSFSLSGRFSAPSASTAVRISRSDRSPVLVVAAAGMFAAMLFGFAIGSGSTFLVVALAGLAGAGVMMVLPGTAAVGAMMVVCLFAIGIATYFLHVKQAIWLAYGLGFAFYLRAAVLGLTTSKRPSPPFSLVTTLIFLFVIVIGTTLINSVSVIQTIVGTKNIIGPPGLFLFLAVGGVTVLQAESIYRWLLIAPIIQIPFAAYQNFVIAPQRGDYASWDAVVGTMGGNPEAGGASGALAILMTAAGILAFALYRNSKISFPVLAGILVCCFGPILLAETKVIVIFIPVAILTYLIAAERLSFGGAIVGLALSAVLGLLVLFGYNQVHYVGTAHYSTSIGALLADAFGYSLDASWLNMASGEAGRTAIFNIWWNDVVIRDTAHALLGYGPGASRGDSDFAIGKLALQYDFRIDRSTAAQLLWDIGVLGALVFVLFFVAGLIVAMRLARSKQLNADRRLYVSVSASIIALTLVSLPYSRDLLESPPLSALAMFALGYVGLVGATTPKGAPTGLKQ